MILWRNHIYDIGTLKRMLVVGAVFLVLLIFLQQVSGSEPIAIEHPFHNPAKYTDHARCDNCGMDRNQYARTRYEFITAKGRSYTCSLACLAGLSLKLKMEPRDVKAADYLHPQKMLAADKAFYVIGSKAPGTMTGVSKIALSDKKGAVAFAAQYGGRVIRFKEALAAARKELSGEEGQ